MNNFKKIFNKVMKFFTRIGQAFVRFFSHFKGFFTLIAMQLKEQLNFSFKADKKGTLVKLILFGVMFVALTAIIALVIYFLGFLSVLGNGYVPVSIFNILLYLILILNFLSCIHSVTNSLYFSKDNQVLLTYPVNSGVIFLSKIVVFFVQEVIKNFMMVVPLLIAFGIINTLPWFFYPWIILISIIISLINVSVGSVLSIIYIHILSFLKKSQYITSALVVIGMIVLTVFLFRGLLQLPPDLQISVKWGDLYLPKIHYFSQQVERYSGPLFFIVSLLTGYRGSKASNTPSDLTVFTNYTGPIIGICLLVIVVFFALGYLIARPLFFKMASKPFEYRKIYIKHDFKINSSKAQLEEVAFRPTLQYPIKRKDREGIVNRLSKLLRLLNKEEKLFLRRKISTKRLLRFLNKYSKKYIFEMVPLSEINDFGYVIQTREDVPFLVLVKGIKGKTMKCYDPNYLRKKNHKISSVATSYVKDILVDLRTPGVMISNFMLFIVTPLAIAILNAIFSSINTSFQGQSFTVMFNFLIILLITLASNVSMASIYSREGKASYMLKAAPVDFVRSLTSKLVLRSTLVILSLIGTMILYIHFSNIYYLKDNFTLILFTFIFIYIGHLLWSAELDFMNPQDRLYEEVGASVNNPNELKSAIIAFIISFLMMIISWFLVSKEITTAFIQIFMIAVIFLACRLVLFILKIKGYGTSRSERRDN